MSNWAPEWKAITREERKKFLSEFSSGLKAPPKPRGPLRFTDPVTGTVHEYHWPKRNLKHQPSLVAKFLKFLVIDTWPWDEEDALYFLKTHGVEVVDERPILRTLCLRVLAEALNKDRSALDTLKKALSSPKGRPLKLTDEEFHQKVKKSNLQSQHDRRALLYCDQAWQRYKEGEKRLSIRGTADPASLIQLAYDIIKEGFSRKGKAKEEGKRLFLQRVKQDLGTILPLVLSE